MLDPRIIAVLVLAVTAGWFVCSPGWEPGVAFIMALGGLTFFQLSRFRFMTLDEVRKKTGSLPRSLASAKQSVCVSGNDGKYLVEVCSKSIDDLLDRKVNLKILLVDPDSHAPEMLALIDPRFNSAQDFKNSMQEVLSRLRDWKSRYPSNFEYRLLPILPALGFVIIDPEKSSGQVKIEIYVAKEWTPISSRPHLIIPSTTPEWRNYFLGQWNNYWNLGQAAKLPSDA